MSRNGFGKFIIGGAIGAGIALLFAPKKGEELRKDLLNKISELCDKLSDIDEDEIKNNIQIKVDEIKKGIKELDAEKVKKVAVKKAEELKAKAEDLVKYAKEKGTPILENSAKKVKAETVKVCKEVIKKLEEEK